MSLLQSSLDQMMTKTGNSDDVILLYHPELPVSMREYLLNNATTATLVTTSSAGAEWDSVIYVGYGHTEAFSRAKLTLGIITINEKGVAPEDKVKRLVTTRKEPAQGMGRISGGETQAQIDKNMEKLVEKPKKL